MRLALLLTALFPLSAHALSIQLGSPDRATYEEALEECREIGHGNHCSRALQKGDSLERETFEACLTFKGEDDSSAMDDDTPQYLRGPQGFSRYGSCLKAVKNRSFNAKAVGVCSLMNDFIQHLECLEAVADRAFHDPATDACEKVSYGSSNRGFECLRAVAGKALPKKKIDACEKLPVGRRVACLAPGESDLASCEFRLATVELKVQEISSSSSSRELKRSIQPILDAIRDKSAGGRDAR
jgi:hypothetical protein